MKNLSPIKKFTRPMLMALFLLLLGTETVWSQTLVQYNASALPNAVNASIPVFSSNANLTATPITRGTALVAEQSSASLSSSNWPGAGSAPNNNQYYYFTLASNTGYVIDLRNAVFLFNCQRNNSSGVINAYVYTSADGYTTPVSTTAITNNSVVSVSCTFPNTAVYNNLFNVQIRIYADGATQPTRTLDISDPVTGSGNIRIQGGSVNYCVPVLNAPTSGSPTCAGTTLSFTSSTSSGLAPISYSWAGPNGFTSGVQNPSIPSVTTAAQGTYTVTATNACGSTSASTFAGISSVTLTATATNESCFSACDGSTNIIPSGGISPYSYAWSNGGTTSTLTSLCDGTYTCTVTDAIGCTATTSLNVNYNACAAFPVTTVPCGNTYNKKTQTVSAASVTGAINYRFSFYNNSSGALIAQRTQTSKTLSLLSVSGLYYNTTYKWTVCVDIGNGFGPESNANCTITLGQPLTSLPCGVSYSKFNFYTTVPAPGGVMNYRFKFYDVNTGAVVAQRTQTSNYLYFNTVSGLVYGTTYRWTVACQYPLSSGGSAFGAESNSNCLVTFSAPTTTVPCGNTYVIANGYATSPVIYGALGYRYTFYQNNVQVAQRTQTSNYIYFNQVSGIYNNQSYTWRVEVLYNSASGQVYGPASSPSCTISFGQAAMINDDGNDRSEVDANTERISANDSEPASLSVYPNPASDIVNLVCDETISNVSIYTLTGELASTFANTKQIYVGDLPAGTYFILAQTASGLIKTTLIKE